MPRNTRTTRSQTLGSNLAWAALPAALGLVAALGLAEAQQPTGKRRLPSIEIVPSQPPPPLVMPGPEPDLEILFSSNVQGFYQPCG